MHAPPGTILVTGGIGLAVCDRLARVSLAPARRARCSQVGRCAPGCPTTAGAGTR